MMDSNLIIDDEYVQEVGRLCNLRGRKFEEVIDSYINILGEIEAEAIVEGEITKSLTAYKECVELLNDKLLNLSSSIKTVCNAFIIDINTADDYLF